MKQLFPINNIAILETAKKLYLHMVSITNLYNLCKSTKKSVEKCIIYRKSKKDIDMCGNELYIIIS